MKIAYTYILLLLFSGCSYKGVLKRNKKSFVTVADYLVNSGKSKICAEDVKDNPSIKSKMKRLRMEGVVLNNFNSGYPNEPADSAVVFINQNLFKYKKVIYDYSKILKLYPDTTIEHKNYSFKHINKRFYYSIHDQWAD